MRSQSTAFGVVFVLGAVLTSSGASATPPQQPKLKAALNAAKDGELRRALVRTGKTLYLTHSDHGLVVVPGGLRYQDINISGWNVPVYTRVATTRLGELWQKANYSGRILRVDEGNVAKSAEQISREVAGIKAEAASLDANATALRAWLRTR